MENEDLAAQILRLVGGSDNVASVTNCMTRVRLTVRDDTAIQDVELRGLDGVLTIVHDRAGYVEVVVGPGKSRTCADALKGLGAGASPNTEEVPHAEDGTSSVAKHLMKTLGQVFAPLIPGIIAAGLCTGAASILRQCVPAYEDVPALVVLYNLLAGAGSTIMAYLTAWAGYRAAEVFGGTPILGGMLGMFTMLDNVNAIASTMGLYDDAEPLNAILRSGRGGVLAAVVGVWLMCCIERAVHKRMPATLDVVFTPLVTLLVALVPYVLVVMPALGFVSSLLCDLVGFVAINPSPLVRMLAGFLGAALFLPMVAMGMHHGLIAIYTVQLDTFGYVTLYPALAMAGAGLVGASVAIATKAKRIGNDGLVQVIGGALPAGVLGIGEPLIYGMALPLGKPFVTAGLGAGVGGAFVMFMQVASTTWGPSGILGTFVMTEGPHGPIVSMGCYLAGLLISAVMGWLITRFAVSDEDVAAART